MPNGRCGIPDCTRTAVPLRGGYCEECYQEYKVGRMVGRIAVPNGRCIICDQVAPEGKLMCQECERQSNDPRNLQMR